MNIFFLDRCARKAAAALCDAHFCMIRESAQILYCVLQFYWKQQMPDVKLPDGTTQPPYLITHKDHPSVLWAAASEAHTQWLINHARELGRRFSNYNKCLTHMSSHHIDSIAEYFKAHAGTLMPNPLSMEEFVEAYPKAADKVSSLHAPYGCEYGVVCADPSEDAPDVRVFYNGLMSVTHTYCNFYIYKAKYKFAMKWMQTSTIPDILCASFDSYAPTKSLLTAEEVKAKRKADKEANVPKKKRKSVTRK